MNLSGSESARIEPLEILSFFYPEDTPLRRLLLKHSAQVREKALALLEHSSLRGGADPFLVAAGAMLHDIGIVHCHAPKILCTGSEPYLAHGLLGARMLREYGAARDMAAEIEPFARICERHTGSGITAEEVRRQQLPIPERDYLPETIAEKAVCLADKFFSKSGDMREKPLERIRRSMAKFGPGPAERFEALCRLFELGSRDYSR